MCVVELVVWSWGLA